MHYYVPPPPPPPPPPPKPQTGTSAPGFQHALTVARQATTAYSSGHASETTVKNDWTTVEAIIAEQYRIAWTSSGPKSDPKAAVAALDRQYASYFQGHRATWIYDQAVADGKGQAEGETDAQRKAQVKLWNAQGEPADSKTRTDDILTAAVDVTQADMNAGLQHRFGNGNNGVYTAGQIQQTAAALEKVDSADTPLIGFVAKSMVDSEKGVVDSQKVSKLVQTIKTNPNVQRGKQAYDTSIQNEIGAQKSSTSSASSSSCQAAAFQQAGGGQPQSATPISSGFVGGSRFHDYVPPPATPRAPTTPSAAQVSCATAGIESRATNYTPTDVTVTVKDAITKAITPVVNRAQSLITAAQGKLTAAQNQLGTDQTAVTATNANLNRVYDGPDGARMLNTAKALNAQLKLETQQVSIDKQRVATARQGLNSPQIKTARATVAAGNAILFGNQAKSDINTANASYAGLVKSLPTGMTLKEGDTLTSSQLAGLNASQQIAYSIYLNDQAKVGADIAMSNQYNAQLQLYASNQAGYGTSAANAVGAINDALAPPPLQMHWAGPSPTDAASAQKALDAATGAATLANAEWNYTTAAVTVAKDNVPLADAAKTVGGLQQQIASRQAQLARDDRISSKWSGTQKFYAPQQRDLHHQIAALQKQLSAAQGPLNKATATAATDQIMLNLTSAYVGKLQAGNNPAVLAAQSQVKQVQAAYDQWRKANPHLATPGNKYELALGQAQQYLAKVTQQAQQVADAGFVAAYGQYVAAQAAGATTGQQKLNALAAVTAANNLTASAGGHAGSGQPHAGTAGAVPGAIPAPDERIYREPARQPAEPAVCRGSVGTGEGAVRFLHATQV
jgi:hypothetical protein